MAPVGQLDLPTLFGGLPPSPPGPAGLVNVANHQNDAQLSPPEKNLAVGGLIQPGTGRTDYRQWAGSQETLGETPVGMPVHSTPALPAGTGQVANPLPPGIAPQTAKILAAPDSLQTAGALGKWTADHQVNTARLATVVDALASKIAPEAVAGGVDQSGLRGAQLDLAKAKTALESGLFDGQSKRTTQFRQTLEKALRNTAALKPNEVDALTTDLATFGQTTQRIASPDLKFDNLAKIKSMAFTDDGDLVVQMTRPPTGAGQITLQELTGLAGTERPPVQFSPGPKGQLDLRSTPSGSLAVFGDVTNKIAAAVRYLYPEHTNDDTRWVPSIIRRVRDLKPVLDDLNGPLPNGKPSGHVIESYDNTSLGDGHPAVITGNHVVVTVPDNLVAGFKKVVQGASVRELPGSTIDKPDPEEPDLRKAVPGRRFHVELPVKAEPKDLAQVAQDVKMAGGTDVVAYGHTDSLGPDFTPTRDHLFTDGNRTIVHRSLDPNITSPNGFRSFVPNDEAVGLPTVRQTLNARALDTKNVTQDPMSGLSFVNNEVAVASDHLPNVVLKRDVFASTVQGTRTNSFTISTAPGQLPVVTLGRTPEEANGMMGLGGIPGQIDRRGNVTLTPPDTTDMAPVYQAADTLRRMGYNPAKITVAGTGDVERRLV